MKQILRIGIVAIVAIGCRIAGHPIELNGWILALAVAIVYVATEKE